MTGDQDAGAFDSDRPVAPILVRPVRLLTGPSTASPGAVDPLLFGHYL